MNPTTLGLLSFDDAFAAMDAIDAGIDINAEPVGDDGVEEIADDE